MGRNGIYDLIRKHNRELNEDSPPSLTEDLYERFKAMSPKERNEALQALFSAHLAGREEMDDTTVTLLKALMTSFNVSIKFEELEGEDNGDAF
jgi:tRNA uridine 5-carbamoylmethylation protein Kti12